MADTTKETLPKINELADSVEKSEDSLNKVVAIVKGNSKVKKLLLLAIVLFALFNPISSGVVFSFFPSLARPEWFTTVFCTVEVLIVIMAFVVAWTTKTEKPIKLSGKERRTIKGLRHFIFADSEIF